MVQPDKVSSLFIYGAEEVVRGNSMVCTCHFAHDLDLARVRSSYDELIRNRPELRVNWQYQQATKSYEWVPFSAAELTTLLAREQASLSRFHTFEEVVADYSPTNERLLVRLTLLDARTVAFEVNHTLTNADGGLYWMQEWLRFYERTPHEGPPEPTVLPVSPRPAWWRRLGLALVGIFWLCAYLLSFLRRAGKHSGAETVDLSHGRRVEVQRKGYACKTYVFSPEQTQSLVSRCKQEGLTVTEKFVALVAAKLFEAQPDRRRVCVSIPIGLSAYDPHRPMSAPGNYTGSLFVQLFRDQPLHRQAKAGLKWARRRIPYSMTRLLAMVGNEAKLGQAFADKARSPLAERGPMEQYSFALSSPGVVRLPALERHCTQLSAHTYSQTIFIGVGTFRGVMTMEVCAARDLFDEAEVFQVTDAIFETACWPPAGQRQGSAPTPPLARRA